MFGIGAGIETGLSIIGKIRDLWKRGSDANNESGIMAKSYVDYTQVARVEPIVLIDTDCLYLDSISEVQQSLLSIFAGYYLQAVAISTTVGKINVLRNLDKLNPSRSASGNAANVGMGWLLAQESYKYKLPLYNEEMSLEAMSRDEIEERKLELQYARYDFDTKNEAYSRMNDAAKEAARAKEAMDRNKFEEAKLQHQYAEFDFNVKNVYIKNDLEKAKFDKSVQDSAYLRMSDAAKEAARTKEVAARAEEFKQTFELNKEKFGHDKAMDILKNDLAKAGLSLREKERDDRLSASEIGFGRDTTKELKELANLSVGKVFTVEITDGLHKVSIPITIRLMASSLPSANLIHILSIGNKDNSVKERYHAWKAGRLEFIKDLIFCQDLIDAHRKNLMADKDGIYTNILKRARSNQVSAIVTANPSIATVSNLVILSNTTAEQLELHLDGKLSDFKTREKMMDTTYIMILCVIDKQWNRVTFYHRGMHLPTEVSVKDLKAANKGNGPDVSDILKAYQVGNQVSI
jgi:hypothetical protein